MSVFSEPEDYEAALRKEGCLGLLVTGRGQFRARLTQITLHRLRLSRGEEQLSRIAAVPGDENFLRKETPTIAEFFKKNGYTTYFSGKWHLGDKPVAYPTAHGFVEMKNFTAYYAGVYCLQ